LINKSIDQSVFPEKLKAAQVSPLFKKNNSLDKSNYRQCLANHKLLILTLINCVGDSQMLLIDPLELLQ
jgi:hypothetical protein